MKKVKTIIKAFIVAFSIYSKIPMPRFNWESEDMKYHLCFFPWVGGVIGGLEIGLFWMVENLELNNLFYITMALAIPLLVTGGFHLDGFMDTCDAIHSYQPREKKLEILKDPHIGAFAVICTICYFLLAAAGVSLIHDTSVVGILALGFFLSRVISGLGVIVLPSAKKQGMLQTFSDTAEKKRVWVILVCEGIGCGVGMLLIQPVYACLTILSMTGTFLYYNKMSRKEFGGITGDLAGYFVTVSELVMVLVLTLAGIIVGMGEGVCIW